MKTAICTISTTGHLFKTKALFHSLSPLTDAAFYCLTIDGEPEFHSEFEINAVSLTDLKTEVAVSIKSKYKGDKLRWACKPLLLTYLLSRGFEKVIYVDNDVLFYSSPNFLFEELNDASLLLTPHHYLADPKNKQFWLEANFRIGLYNAGFVGANFSALHALEWWAQCCLYNVRKSAWRGLFDDQRYLDLLPNLYKNVTVLEHKGCNVASWNVDQCPRSLEKDGEVLIADRWPLVFIHFNGFTMRAILNENDPLLQPHLESYFELLKKYDPKFSSSMITKYGLSDLLNYSRHILWNLARVFD